MRQRIEARREIKSCEILSTNKRKTRKVLVKEHWEPLPASPENLTAGMSAVVGSKAYFQNKGTQTVYAYDSSKQHWSKLRSHPLLQCSLVCINHNLTTVGGYNRQGIASRLYSLKDDHWIENLPPMPTKHESPTVVCDNKMLIVAGG